MQGSVQMWAGTQWGGGALPLQCLLSAAVGLDTGVGGSSHTEPEALVRGSAVCSLGGEPWACPVHRTRALGV